MQRKRDRRSIRLRGYDYAQEGWYFITICVNGFNEVFGEITEGKFTNSKWGEIVENCWKESVQIRKETIDIDIFQVMPNHFHCIIIIGSKESLPNITGFPDITGEETTFQSPIKTVGSIIRGFKASVTSKIKKMENVDDLKLWQRNYYERIVRNEEELNRIRDYIHQNPSKWGKDKEFFKKLLKRMTKR